jgi:uncharacterized cupredoxin-like copper-binding protein
MRRRNTVRRLVATLAAAVIAAAVAGGCENPSARNLSIVAGETREDGERGGYALEGDEITSNPGATFRTKLGERVTIRFDNVHGIYHGETWIEHDFVVVADRPDFMKAAPEALWSAKTSVIRPEDPPEVVTFTPDAVGAYYYICSVPGHVERGMWGRFVVEK